MKKRYCKIKFCENRFDSRDDVSFFRLPQDDKSKTRWIEAISKHQEFSPSCFMICERHFAYNDFGPKSKKVGKKVLKKGAIPSIFDDESVDFVQPEKSSSNEEGNSCQKRYCKIKFCRNEIGTENKDILFFRVPKDGKSRNQWIKSISKYQEYDFYSTYFTICEHHFYAEDFVERTGKRRLKSHAVPSDFSTSVSQNCISGPHNTVKTKGCSIEQCSNGFNGEENAHFFRMPLFGSQRTLWIESISKHQEFDFFKSNFNVCEAHFTSELFIKNGMLRSDAVPSLFQAEPSNDQHDNISDLNSPQFYEIFPNDNGGNLAVEVICKKCMSLNIEILKEIDKVEELKKKQSKLNEMLKTERKKVKEMQMEIEKLKAENEKFNVNSNDKTIIECLAAKKPPKSFEESIRSFSLTLNSLSPRAYRYVRGRFHDNLPHPSTIQKWYANSHSNGQPGLSKDSLETLRKLVVEHGNVYCTLSFDEMNIRRNVQWSDRQKKFLGGISYGSIPDNAEYMPIANNAIVFMINGINFEFNLPVQFEFINCLKFPEKAAMILSVLKEVTNVGIKIIAMTFDGLANNFRTCFELGARFNVNGEFKPYIINPYSNEKVFIILDPPHMLKLIRNCIGNMKTLYHDGKPIEWKFFEILVDLRNKCDVVSHKLTKEHILFDKNIMNVRLATETLSESVARSMEQLATHPQTQHLFKASNHTMTFTRRMNSMFDIFNSNKICPNNVFKSPINNDSKQFIFSFLDETVEYLKKLSLNPNGDSILSSKRQTGFKGFIINARNLQEIYLKYVETGKIKEFLATRSLNQDPVENFFGRIRSCLGSNDNPTTEQFCAAYRKVLVSTELTCSTFANCSDQLNILRVPSSNQGKMSTKPAVVRVSSTFYLSRKRGNLDTNVASIDTLSSLLNQYQNVEGSDQFTFDGAEITISHLANIIEHKIEHQVRSNCEECVKISSVIFRENDKYSGSNTSASVNLPCQSTVDIGQVCNNFLRLHAYKIGFDYLALMRCIDEELENNDLFSQTDFQHNLQHKQDLIRFIIEEFLRIRATFLARKITLNERQKLLRRKSLKLVHFSGE